MKKKTLAALCLSMSLCFSACSPKAEDLYDPEVYPDITDEEFASPDDTLPEGAGDISGQPAESEQPTAPDSPESEPQSPEPEPPQTEQPSEPEPEEPKEEMPAVTKPQAPQVKKDTLISSTTDGLNVRRGAGTKYSALGTLDKSDMAMPVRKVGSWYEINYRNTLGYVSAAYVKPVDFAVGSNAVEQVITEGKKLLGIPYELGAQRYHWGNGTLNGSYTGKTYDCSSLMQYIFKVGANVNLDMTSRAQSLQGKAVSSKNIRRGDLLFFTNASRVNKTGLERIGHVALYLGDNIILHTASDHAVIEPISAKRWGYYITARRML